MSDFMAHGLRNIIRTTVRIEDIQSWRITEERIGRMVI